MAAIPTPGFQAKYCQDTLQARARARHYGRAGVEVPAVVLAVVLCCFDGFAVQLIREKSPFSQLANACFWAHIWRAERTQEIGAQGRKKGGPHAGLVARGEGTRCEGARGRPRQACGPLPKPPQQTHGPSLTTCTIYSDGARHPRHLNARVSVLLLRK